MPDEKRILCGVPIPPNFMADARVVAQVEAWHAAGDGVESYYPTTRSAESGQHKIVHFALYAKPRATHILFLDYDVIPRPNTLKRLLSHDKDIISGVYPIYKNRKIVWCLSTEEPFAAMSINDIPNNIFKAKTICNGMMLVKTEVFDKLEWPYWESKWKPGGYEILGADVHFCMKARDAGFDLWVDPKVKCEHIKSVGLLGIAKTYIMKGK
ncbi:hypothetical protein LCGC14_0434540 [marine sediment metagenome]|uniref:Glycosyltransferase 2-like domain-containing protein n=1 Tax=marine sediment metagenome TaxID=412755 RepID=A0A0F9STK0_9ZZZZ